MAKPSRALLQARNASAALALQIDSLAQFLATFPGEPRAGEGAIETAIRLLDGHRATINELEQANSVLGEDLMDAGRKAKVLQTANAQLTTEREKARQEGVELANENAHLRDQMLITTTANSRLQGEINVLREFAPVPERDRYLDQLPRRERGPVSFDSVGSGAMSSWHHRKG